MVRYIPRTQNEFYPCVPLRTLEQDEYDQYCKEYGCEIMEHLFMPEEKERKHARNETATDSDR